MAAGSGKRPKASLVKQTAIEETNAFLQDLPDKPKEELSLKEAIELMRDPLRSSLAKGYTYQELAAMLTEKGIKISAFTLKNYVPSGRRKTKEQVAAKSGARRGKKAASAEKAAPAKPEVVVAETPKAKEAPAKAAPKTTRSRTKATAAAKSKSGTEATVKQPATKTTRTSAKTSKSSKPATKTTTTRSRKKPGS